MCRQLFPSWCCLCRTVPQFLETRSVGRDRRFPCEGWPQGLRHLVHTLTAPSFPERVRLSSQPCVAHSLPCPDLPKMIYFFLPSFISPTSCSGRVDCAYIEALCCSTLPSVDTPFPGTPLAFTVLYAPRGTSRIPLPCRSFPLDTLWIQEVPWFL